MSVNDGGDPVRLSRAPVERPDVPRGHLVGPRQRDEDGLLIGALATFTMPVPDAQGVDRWQITLHNVQVVGQASNEAADDYRWIVDVTPATVVTWEPLA